MAARPATRCGRRYQGFRRCAQASLGGHREGQARWAADHLYYWYRSHDEIWLLTLYAKNEASDISPDVLKAIRREVESWLKRET